jgi:Fe-S cluster biogenesis protein NfuA
MSAPDAAQGAADRVDQLLGELRESPDPRAAGVAEELARCLVQLYGAGLARIVGLLGPDRGAELCADPLVESLLLVHDLHPLDTDARVRRAVDGLRPVLGDVEYLGVDAAGVARVRLAGGARGCGSSAAAARSTIEDAVRRAAPEAAGVEVDVPPAPPPLLQVSLRPGLAPAPAPARAAGPGPGPAGAAAWERR